MSGLAKRPLVNFEIEVYPNNISITVAVASLAVAL
jgi:hypothetical protein